MFVLTEKEVAVLDAYARCGMCIAGAAKELFYCNGSVVYYLDKVRKRTGRNPRNFFELAELLGYRRQETIE